MRFVIPLALSLATASAAAAEVDDAAMCAADASALAGKLGITIGRQTRSVVFLNGTPAKEASFGCASAAAGEDVFVAYEGPRIPNTTLQFIGKAGSAFVGANAGLISAKVKGCLTNALMPDAGEMAEVETKAFTVECHAFTRNGGGGSVNLYKPRG